MEDQPLEEEPQLLSPIVDAPEAQVRNISRGIIESARKRRVRLVDMIGSEEGDRPEADNRRANAVSAATRQRMTLLAFRGIRH